MWRLEIHALCAGPQLRCEGVAIYDTEISCYLPWYSLSVMVYTVPRYFILPFLVRVRFRKLSYM